MLHHLFEFARILTVLPAEELGTLDKSLPLPPPKSFHPTTPEFSRVERIVIPRG